MEGIRILVGLTLILMAVFACTPAPIKTVPPTSPPTTFPETPGQPIAVVSVLDTYKVGQTVNPGGPSIEITLKKVSTEDVVSLAVALEERGREFNFDFDVSPSHSLAPGKTTSARQILIGGGWGAGIAYSLAISGTLRSGAGFSFIWEPKN
jgi:hypothetical protein